MDMDDLQNFNIERRRLLATAAGAAVLGAGAASTALAAEPQADFLFVQTADAVSFDAAAGKMTLIDISPVTLFFSDRPERIAGNMKTSAFVPFWSEGTDSFLSDPPNADISVFEEGKLRQTVVVLKSPGLDGGNLSYDIEIVNGEMPASGTEVSVFIDIIGMPLTPLSYAGARRRMYRRAVLYR